MHRGGLVPHALTDREAPAAAGDPLPEAVSDGELPHISAHGAGRPDPQRHAHRAAQTGRLVRVPGPAIIEEGRHPDPHEAPRVFGIHEFTGTHMAWLAARLGAAESRTFDVEDQGLPREILACHGERARLR